MSLCLLQGLMDTDTGVVSVPHFSNVHIPATTSDAEGLYKIAYFFTRGNHNQFNTVWSAFPDGLNVIGSPKRFYTNADDLDVQQTNVVFRIASLFVRDVLSPPVNTTARVERLLQRANVSAFGTFLWDNGRRVFDANAPVDLANLSNWNAVISQDLSVFKTDNVAINDYYRLGRRLIALRVKPGKQKPRIQLRIIASGSFSSIHVQLLQDEPAGELLVNMTATITSIPPTPAGAEPIMITSTFHLQPLTTVVQMRDVGAQHLRVLHTVALPLSTDTVGATMSLELTYPSSRTSDLVVLLGDIFVV